MLDKEKKKVKFNNDVKIHYYENHSSNNIDSNIYYIGIFITAIFLFIFILFYLNIGL